MHEPTSTKLQAILDEEESLGVTNGALGHEFADRFYDLKNKLKKLLNDINTKGNQIAAYGAAAKGIVLLSVIGADKNSIEYVVDKSSQKQGKLLPGSKIPIVPETMISENPPDYLIILPWNLTEEIIAQLSQYTENGGKLIVPLPSPQILP